MPFDDPLTDAIHRLYTAFASTRRPKVIDWCAHCRSADDVSALLGATALRELSPDALRPYAASALLTIGDVADFRYYLPRIFEIAGTTGFDWPDLESLAGRLRLAAWTSWRTEEQEAIRGLLRALWSKALATHPSRPDAESVLCAIGEAEDELTVYLDEWTASLRHQPAATGLLDLLRYSIDASGSTKVSRGAQDHQVTRWLFGPVLRAAVADAFDTSRDEVLLRTLADIDELLGMYSRSSR